MDPANLKNTKKNTNTKSDDEGGESDYENLDPQTAGETEKDTYIEKIRGQFRYDLLAHDNYIQNFDAYEAMLISRPYDSVSKKVQNGLSDGRTTTIYQERSARVCGQLPTGSMKAAGKKDTGASAVLDIILQKYVYPNANAQAPLLEKFRNWQFYSSVYGFMPMYYDWDAPEDFTPGDYVGPNCWLWHPRNFIPQIGRASVEDMDYVTALTFAGEEYIKELCEMTPAKMEEGGWDEEELENLLGLIEERTRFPDARRDSLVTRERQSQPDKGRIMLATRYEAGDDGNWVVFAPEYNGVVIRLQRNPHKNGRIPFIVKYATPLFDNFYGLGDFQRAKPLQFASDGLDNFYFAGLKRGLYPATIINPAGVVKSSLTNDPGAFWLETVPNSIREYKTDAVGLTTYQAAKTLMNGALVTQSGTVDTTVNSSNSADPSASKTDAGVNQAAQKESDRDNQDRFYMESRQEQLIDRMMGLFGVMGTEDIPVNLFAEDFEDIKAAGWSDDLKGMLDISESGQSAKMTIKPSFFNKLDLRFQMDPGSTASTDKQAMLDHLEGFVKNIGSLQNVMTQMNDQGWMLDVVQISKLEEDLGDVPEMGKIFRKMTPDELKTYQQSQTAKNPPKPPEQIDTTAYKDLPDWAKAMRLQKEGYTIPPGASFETTDQNLKTAEVAAKVHSATKPEPAPAPAAEPTPPPEFHNGTLIKDPVIASAHNKIGDMVNG